jgi:hyperosmotically inducible protein
MYGGNINVCNKQLSINTFVMKWKNAHVITLLLFMSVSLFISCKGKPSDADIQTEVSNKISNRAGITATVNEGVVTLTGECPDNDCRTNSENAVKDVKGVKSVINNITIVTVEQAAPVQIMPDDQLKAAVEGVLTKYKDVKAEVKDGVVTLRGEILRDNLQNLIISLNGLKPKKIQNELVIK